jgi:hypothetical protein
MSVVSELLPRHFQTPRPAQLPYVIFQVAQLLRFQIRSAAQFRFENLVCDPRLPQDFQNLQLRFEQALARYEQAPDSLSGKCQEQVSVLAVKEYLSRVSMP